MSKTILLVDTDSKEGFPNLALMKISAWYKQKGYTTDLIRGIPEAPPLFDYAMVYISCVFAENKERVLEYASWFESDNIMIGGSGIDYTMKLEYDIEHIMPDYELYGYDFSIGFTSRGCIRNCDFCIVPEKEGMIQDHAHIKEFHHPEHTKVMLLDNNFQASPRWKENSSYILDNRLKANFGSGFDFRLLDEEFANILAQMKYYDRWWKSRRIYFAYDWMSMERPFERGMKLLESVGIPPKHVMVYVLTGFNTTQEQDLYRIKKIHTTGAKPYVMIYNNTPNKEIRRVARWVNRRYIDIVPWENYIG